MTHQSGNLQQSIPTLPINASILHSGTMYSRRTAPPPPSLDAVEFAEGKKRHTHTHTRHKGQPASQSLASQDPGTVTAPWASTAYYWVAGTPPPFQQATYPKASCMALFFVASHTDFTPNYLRKGRGRRKIIMLVCDKAHN